MILSSLKIITCLSRSARSIAEPVQNQLLHGIDILSNSFQMQVVKQRWMLCQASRKVQHKMSGNVFTMTYGNPLEFTVWEVYVTSIGARRRSKMDADRRKRVITV